MDGTKRLTRLVTARLVGESVLIGGTVRVTVAEVVGPRKVRLLVEAPADVRVETAQGGDSGGDGDEAARGGAGGGTGGGAGAGRDGPLAGGAASAGGTGAAL